MNVYLCAEGTLLFVDYFMVLVCCFCGWLGCKVLRVFLFLLVCHVVCAGCYLGYVVILDLA